HGNAQPYARCPAAKQSTRKDTSTVAGNPRHTQHRHRRHHHTARDAPYSGTGHSPAPATATTRLPPLPPAGPHLRTGRTATLHFGPHRTTAHEIGPLLSSQTPRKSLRYLHLVIGV